MVGITNEQREESIQSYQRFARTLNDEQLAARFGIASLHQHEQEAMTREICTRWVGLQVAQRILTMEERGTGWDMTEADEADERLADQAARDEALDRDESREQIAT